MIYKSQVAMELAWNPNPPVKGTRDKPIERLVDLIYGDAKRQRWFRKTGRLSDAV